MNKPGRPRKEEEFEKVVRWENEPDYLELCVSAYTFALLILFFIAFVPVVDTLLRAVAFVGVVIILIRKVGLSLAESLGEGRKVTYRRVT